MLTFIKESFAEFKKVQWPTKKQTVRLTVMVIGVSLIVAIYVGLLDLGYEEILNLVL